jgi:GT2 family glycosyltransferase
VSEAGIRYNSGVISVVMNSRDDERFRRAKQWYAEALNGADYELVRIPDALGMCEGYNRGIARAKGDTIILSHDDVQMLSTDLAERVEAHLSRFDLIGVAGTTRVCNPFWAAAGPPHVYGQIVQARAEKLTAWIWGAPDRAVANIQGMDGVFLACRRSLFNRVKFDAAYTGWHLYDLDFTFSAYLAGFQLAVVNDLYPVHHEQHDRIVDDAAWRQDAGAFMHKFGSRMPRPIERAYAATQVRVETLDACVEVMTPPHWPRVS